MSCVFDITEKVHILRLRNNLSHERFYTFTAGRHSGESPVLHVVHDDRLRSDLPIFFNHQMRNR